MKHNKVALGLIFCLFFLWAISSNLLPTMIRQLMKTCELNTFEASFTESAYWLAYFVCPIPIAMFMRRYSYRVGIITGLLIAAMGGLLFFPAAMVKSYGVYLCIFFIIATGMCFLETAANPYVTVLGDAHTAPRRLNLAQSFNGLGAFISAMFLSKLVLSGNDFTRDTLPADYLGGWDAYIQTETDSMKLPYLLLASALILVALILVWVKLPKVGDEEQEAKGKLIDFSALKKPHLCWGVIAQFFYNGGQTAVNSLFLVYCCTYAGIDEDTATTFFGLYMLAFLVGRWIGTLLMGRFKPEHMLTVYALANVVLCVVIMVFGGYVGLYAMLAVSFFMSIIYPTQFSLAIDGLGEQTKSGSAFLVMAAIEVIFLYETQSRNALLAIGVFLVVAILAAMLGPGRIVLHKWLFAFVSVFPLLFVGAYMAFVGNEDLMQAFSFLSGEGKGLGSRTSIWQDALDRFWESPIFGAYSQLSNGSGMSQMHNTHMDILASYGIVVLILTCVFLYLIMARSWDGGNRQTRIVGVAAFECVIMLCVGEAALFAGGLAVYVFMGYFLLYANQASESLPGEVGEA